MMHRKLNFTWVLAGLAPLLAMEPTLAPAGPIVSGFNTNTLVANDDLSAGPVNLEFSFNFFGAIYAQTYVNNNGNITFNASLDTYTPFGLTSDIGRPIIVSFFADVDTRGAGNGLVSHGTGTYNGHTAFGVNWPAVGITTSTRTNSIPSNCCWWTVPTPGPAMPICCSTTVRSSGRPGI